MNELKHSACQKTDDLTIISQATTNPASYKFVVNTTITTESHSYTDVQSANESPLARKLFTLPWVDHITICNNYVTITKQDWVDWSQVIVPITKLIFNHIKNGEPIMQKNSCCGCKSKHDDNPVVTKIKKILDEEIRPSVALDGGDIVFEKYENKKVYVHMRGACSGCPMSTMTLKMGVEARLKESIPEIEEVIAL